MELLDVATVIEGDGHWTISYEIDAMACGRNFDAVDICTPTPPPVPTDALTGFKANPFAIVGTQRFGARCGPDDAAELLADALAAATEWTVANAFYTGSITGWTSTMHLADAGVATVAAGATPADSVAAALELAFNNHPDLQPILHLGWLSALKIQDSLFDQAGIPVVISPGYPKAAIAVTGPITVHLGSVEPLSRFDEKNNRQYVSATRLAAFDFDPCLAVRVT